MKFPGVEELNVDDAIVQAYARTRDRMIALVSEPGIPLNRTIPACPEWTAKDLLGHVVAMPAALSAGRLPQGSVAEWLVELVRERGAQPVEQLTEEWRALDPAMPKLLAGGSSLLFGDLAVHEHDLRAALGRPDHGALEVDVMLPRTLAGFARPLREAGLGALEVRGGDGCWQSHEGPVGWSLHVDAWEGVRAVNSRRTAAELLALPGEGDAAPYLPVLDAHLPLPSASLGE
jgi:hypothetical protein